MAVSFRKLVLGMLLISLTFLTCSKDEVQATDSIEGVWDVVEIRSHYGDFSGSAFNLTESVAESGALGTFDFMRDAVDFEFTRNDTLFVGSGPWDITAKKVRDGFVRITKFTLTIEDLFLFDVVFADATKNAEKEATSATFTQDSDSEAGVIIEMKLEKR